ncbi:MAG: class I SAM-dependent methyltransferase [Mariniphaga sp.]|nr:class I SAM-dependent methyltransferase [Mariniphaga sp.]
MTDKNSIEYPFGFDHSHIRLSWDDELLIHLIDNLEKLSDDGYCIDIGAGNGSWEGIIKQRGYNWVGIDVNPSEKVLFADAHDLPFEDKTFDLVLINKVLRYLHHPWKAMQEINRVLKNESYLIGCVSFLEPFDNTYYQFSHWGIKQLLEDSGFTVISIIPGTSVFRTLVHNLIMPGPSTLESILVACIIPPFMLLRKILGWAFIFIKYGKKSDEYKKFVLSFDKLPLKLAGHIIFLAKKTNEST